MSGWLAIAGVRLCCRPQCCCCCRLQIKWLRAEHEQSTCCKLLPLMSSCVTVCLMEGVCVEWYRSHHSSTAATTTATTAATTAAATTTAATTTAATTKAHSSHHKSAQQPPQAHTAAQQPPQAQPQSPYTTHHNTAADWHWQVLALCTDQIAASTQDSAPTVTEAVTQLSKHMQDCSNLRRQLVAVQVLPSVLCLTLVFTVCCFSLLLLFCLVSLFAALLAVLFFSASLLVCWCLQVLL